MCENSEAAEFMRQAKSAAQLILLTAVPPAILAAVLLISEKT